MNDASIRLLMFFGNRLSPMLPMDRLLYLVWLLALCWSLGAAQSLKIKVVDEDGKVRRDFSDGSAAFQDRSYLLPDKQNGAIKGVLVYPVPRNACSVVTHPPNDTYIAYLEEYETCPERSAGYLKTAGYSAVIAYSANTYAFLVGNQYIPQALILDKDFSTYLADSVIPETNETSNLMVVIWDDSFAKLEQLFIIFGVVLLVAVFLSVCVFCSSLFCRVALVRWRTRGLASWQVRSLPKRKFRKAKELMDTCSICLDEFKEGETVRVLPCNHVFHPKCVDEWLKKWNRTCPLCKSTIKRKGGRTQNPPAQTDENETSLLLPHSRASSMGIEDRDHEDGESPDYGSTGMTTLSPGPGGRGHRHRQHWRSVSGSSSGSNDGNRNQVTSAEIELSAETNPERLSSPCSLYHTPLHSDNDEEETPSYATAHSGRASASFHSASTEQV